MITAKELKDLATLARIKITDDDMTSLVKEFDSILEYVDRLKKAQVSLDAEGRIGTVRNIVRSDMVSDMSVEDRERMLDEAPDREGNYVAVKKIIEQD